MSACAETGHGQAWRISDTITRVVDWAVNSQTSSRSSALMRIGIALLFWSRWAGEVALFRDPSLPGLVLSFNFFAATALLFAGYCSRFAAAWAGAVAMAMYTYFGQQLGREPWTHHHTYLLGIAALLLALTPCGRSYSVDRLIALGRAARDNFPPPPESGNVWGLRLIVIQLSALYFFSAFDKTEIGFLSGARLEHIVLWYYAGSDYPALPGFASFAMLTALAVVALEYALAFGLPFAATRRILLPLGIAFHAAIYLTLPVYTFSATMLLLYLAYLDPDAVHRTIDRLQGVPLAHPTATTETT